MARTLKTFPGDMYVTEVTRKGFGWKGDPYTTVYLLGPYVTLSAAKGQASSQDYTERSTVTAKFFKGTMTWEAM